MKSRTEELENELARAQAEARSAREAADRKASDVVDLARRNLMLESRVAELASRMDLTSVPPLSFDGATSIVGHGRGYGAHTDKEGRGVGSSSGGGGMGRGGGGGGGGGSGGGGSGVVHGIESEGGIRDKEQGGASSARGGEGNAGDERGERSEFLARLTPPLGGSVTPRDLLGGSEPHYAASNTSYMHSSGMLRSSGSSALSPTRVASTDTGKPTSTGPGVAVGAESTNGGAHDK